MDINDHRALTVSAPRARTGDTPSSTLVHAHVWLRYRPEGGDTLERHVHLVRPLAGGAWREVDVSRLPLSPLMESSQGSRPVPMVPPDARDALIRFLDSWHPSVYRVSATGHLSDLEEPLASFRSRVMAVLRPRVQEQIRLLSDGDEPHAAEDKAKMAHEMHDLTQSIEQIATPPATHMARTVELGILVVPAGAQLPAVQQRDVMLEGPPRKG